MTRKTSATLSTLVLAFVLLAAPLPGQFAYVANADSSNVSGYTINAATGALTAIPGSPFPARSNPASVAVDPTGKFAYVANSNSDFNEVSGYTIHATTGALTDIPGSPFPADGLTPIFVAVDPTGKFAYVANLYGGRISGYTINATTGALTAIPGSPFATAGAPQSLAVDPTGKFVYVADINTNDVSAYTINATTGALTAVPGSPFPAGSGPASVAVDPTGKFAYVANSGHWYNSNCVDNGSDVSGYTINATTGALTAIPGSPFLAGLRFAPVAVTVTKSATADLSVTKNDSPDPVIKGNNITYTVIVTNNGPSSATNVTLSDAVPSDTKFVSNSGAAGWSCTNPPTKGTRTGTITCTKSSLASGASATFTIVVEVNPSAKEGTTITNRVTVSSSNSDPNTGNNSVTATTTVAKK